MIMGELHEHYLKNELDVLEQQGYRVLHKHRWIPDAIVVSPDNKVIAVEILSRNRRLDEKGRSKGYRWNKKMQDKKWKYAGFDDVLFVLFNIPDIEPMKRVLASDEWPELYEERTKGGLSTKEAQGER